MKCQDYIISDKNVLLGKLVIKGTRVSVDHVISLLAQGWTEDKIFDNYPRLNKNSLKAVSACSQEGAK